MIEKLVMVVKPYTTKDGKERKDYRFYLVLTNGKRIRVMPYYFEDKKSGEIYSTAHDLHLCAEVLDE